MLKAFECDVADACGFVEDLCKEGWFVFSLVCGGLWELCALFAFAVGVAGVAFVADDDVGLYIGFDVEQGFEVTLVEGFPTRQVEGDDGAGGVRFCVDFRGEAAARATERLPFLTPFAPAADTCARTMVELNIWMRCADELIAASVSKKASKTPALLKRSKRFHTLFQGPKRSGNARHRMFSTVKKWSASRKRRSFSAFRPRRGRQARYTASVCAPIDLIDLRRHSAAASKFCRRTINHA